MIGIYKITSPTKKVYIGQSINIEKRFIFYKRLDCKRQLALYNSLVKHGVEKHKFEILCECEIHELNDKERYYQDVFECIGKNGLNCILTKSSDRSGFFSQETRLKMSISAKKSNENNRHERYKYQKNRSYNHLLNLSLSNIGKKASEETRKKMSISQKNISQESRIKITEANPQRKLVLDTQNGVFYTVKELAGIYKKHLSYFRNRLNGSIKNNTNFIYI